MASYYYALWIPRLTPVPFNMPEGRSEDFRDDPSYPWCHLRTETDGFNIKLFYRLRSLDLEIPLDFIYHSCIRAGFIVYELDTDFSRDLMTRELDGTMHPMIYHFIKEHFHSHTHHDAECDSMLQPYVSDHIIALNDIKELKNLYKWYLSQYEEMLCRSMDTLCLQYRMLVETTNVWKAFYTSHKKAKLLKIRSGEVAGAAGYARALLTMSPFRVSNQVYQRTYTAILDCEHLCDKCDEAYTTVNNDYNNRLGRYGVYLGAGGIILTLILELFHQCTPSDKTYLEVTEEQMLKFIENQDSILIKLKNRADSLNELNQKMLKD